MFNPRRYFSGLIPLALITISTLDVPAQGPPQSDPNSKAGQRISVSALIKIVGDVSRECELSGEELSRMRRKSVRAKGQDGVESQYEGVPIIDILAKAGVPTGKNLRGPAMALYVIAEAADGYRAAFALAELDSAFTDRVILLADRRDGKLLSAREGPFHIIVPGEKKHARWVRQVTRLKVGRG